MLVCNWLCSAAHRLPSPLCLTPSLCTFNHLYTHQQAFVIPGLLGLGLTAGKHLVGDKLPPSALPGASSIKGNGAQRVMAAFVLVMGLALFGNGILQRVVA